MTSTIDGILKRKYAQWGLTAKRLGQPFQLHRPLTNNINPLPNKIGDIKVALNAESMNFERPNKFGQPIWWAVADGRLLQVGDYFIGSTGTFYVASMQSNLSIQCVECSTTISIYKEDLTSRIKIGQNLVISGLPVSLLRDNNGSTGLDYPDSYGSGEFKFILPPINNGIQYLAGYTIIDGSGNRYIIRVVERTDMGWRFWTQKIKL